MTFELFAPQLVRTGAPLCVLCGGKTMNGLNCTCAVERMWLYRASQGKIDVSVCHIRDLTNDCIGGTNLRQVEEVSHLYGITGGQVYQPVDIDVIFGLVESGRYGSHLNISYQPVARGPHDAFGGRFTGNHDIFLSKAGATTGTIRTGDPGSSAYHDWPMTLLREAAGLLELSPGVTLNDEAGRGKCYAYVTPPDPVIETWWPDYAGPPPANATFAVHFGPGFYWVYNANGTRHGLYPTARGFTAYGNGRFTVNGRLFGKLITYRPGAIVDVHSGAAYWSKH